MKLETSIRVAELQSAIALLTKNFPSPAETALLAAKQAELEKLLPPSPPCPNRVDDLCCTREEIVALIADVEQRAAVTLRILSDPNEPESRKLRIRYTDQNYTRLEAARDKLVRWEMLRAYKLWQADEEYKRNGPTCPNRLDDLNCTREEIVENIARFERFAEGPLRLLSDPQVPEHSKARIRREDPYFARLEAERNRLARWDMLQAWKQWKQNQEAGQAAQG